jgi:hypothetical protein
MTPDAVAEVVARIYTAAGRHAGDAEALVFAEALDKVHDDVALEAAKSLVCREDWSRRPPSPAMLLEYCSLVTRERPAVLPHNDVGPRASAETVATALALARSLSKGVAVPDEEDTVTVTVAPEPLKPRPPTNAHAFGDHDLCGPTCAQRIPRTAAS